LSGRVAVVGVAHSDDPEHYEHVGRLGDYWDGVVAGSHAIKQTIARRYPSLRPRLHAIPYGTQIPEFCPVRPASGGSALKIVYASRLTQVQKRVLDLPGIASALADRGVPFRLTVIGAGEDRDRLLTGLRPYLADGRAEYKGLLAIQQLPSELEKHDVFLLTSDFEGMPLTLLDAMGRGCVPVVTDIPSGIPELVHDGVNGYRLPVGDLVGFGERLAALQRDSTLRGVMALQAHETVSRGGYRVEDMVTNYLTLFRRVSEDAAAGAFRRPRGRIQMPPLSPSMEWLRPSWKDWLPESVRNVLGRCKRAIPRVWDALVRCGNA
jgi:glycosyltransferase involved in cell wall biosynthesis